MGRDMGHGRDYSDVLAQRIDDEVRGLIEQAHDEAYQVLSANREILDRLALELLEKETLDHLQIEEIFKDIQKLPERPQWLSSEDRPVSEHPPVQIPRRPEQHPGVAAQTAAERGGAPVHHPSPGTGKARPATA